MSVHVTAWAWEQALSSPYGKLILIALADNANDDGWLRWPPYPAVVRRVGCDKSTFFKHVGSLEREGVLEIVERPKNPLSPQWCRLNVPWNGDPRDEP